jgi:2-polyprenyl-3-methyl-5-hydroxy-6-metoxy-1,4-benzoquinol methylase
MDIKELDILGADAARHWYYVSKGRALCSLVGTAPVDEVLDIGAGSGVFSRQLIDAGRCRRAVCMDPAYASDSREIYRGREIRFTRAAPTGQHELLLLLDVLEHVSDDVTFLRRYAERLSPDGRIIISVPAFQWLWSGHDVFLAHYRRYTRRSLTRTVNSAGLSILDMRYFFGFILPVAVASRRLERLRQHVDVQPRNQLSRMPAVINGLLIALHDLERVALFPWNRLGGLTVFCVATRR